MNRKLIVLLIALLALSGTGQAQKATTEFDMVRSILTGDWKVDGKDDFESWNYAGQSLTGRGFKLKDGAEVVTERLEIREIEGSVYYLATVANQNDGATIRFRLTESSPDRLQFENPDHDFPKKLIYRRNGPDKLSVDVLGTGDKGFKLELVKLKSPKKPG